MFLSPIPITRTISAISDPNKRMIPRSPALIKILTSISMPNTVETEEIFSTRKLLVSGFFIVLLTQTPRHTPIPSKESINKGSVNKLLS